MKTYQWNSKELKRKSNKYGIFALVMMLAALCAVSFLPNGEAIYYVVSVGCMVAAFGCLLFNLKIQSKDKKLKK